VARISGVDIPANKRIEVSLCYIYGIGPAVSRRILAQTGIDVAKKAKDLTEEEISRLREVIDKGYRVEGDLRNCRYADSALRPMLEPDVDRARQWLAEADAVGRPRSSALVLGLRVTRRRI
jgi:small subunit ribosomal protein S13